MNLNKLIRSKQRKLMVIILCIVAVFVGVLYFLNRHAAEMSGSKSETAEAAQPEPDLTGGTVTNTFDGSGQNSLLVDAQRREKQTRENLVTMQKDFKTLQDQVNVVLSNNQTLQQSVRELLEKLAQQNTQPQFPAAPEVGSRTEYSLGPLPVLPGQIDNTLLDDLSIKNKNPDTSFWIPTGAFSDAIVIEGADTNASVRGENNLVPMQFKLKGLVHLPGNQRTDRLDNCFVTAAAYGDISSERALPQLQRLSCIIDGKHIDQPVKGHVAFYGKNGIRGVPVMRNGKILGLAFTAGALGGLGQSVSQVGQTVAGIGATASISGGEVARSAVGSGVGKAADKLADYYIERAEQYHPIIPVGAANRVEVVFIEGFRAKFIEDEEARKAEKPPTQTAKDSARTQGNTGLPPDLIGRLGDATRLSMDDFVVPVSGKGRQSSEPTSQGVSP
ncbi:TrbI/VirB10 family protein [Pantoea cypripedii]|uniref:Conjugal transfer protein TraB n=1 Tax=Pantoea cypripedii TaxID=55209 RepID=A0A1X1EKV4_PANCY|nr:TrbI/VirB10 family protein [Pantoea cypripedii]MBP2199065.1 conjugal transfer pilus assembly protein TraB [Pantoea cypripedii]ORM89473.1 hypothetical protein HA50_22865 [Pantoea cypripedii]